MKTGPSRWGDALAPGIAVAALALLAGFISLPLLSLVIWTVNEEAWRAVASPVAVDALLLSIRTTAVTMAIILVVGTPAAYVLARADFPGKRMVDTLVDIPAVLPPSAAGIALLLAFGRMGLLGEHLQILGVQLSFTTAAVVLAELFVATHFYVRQAAVGFGRVDRGVEEAAMVDGASRMGVFSRVTVPLAFPALLAGAVTAWARALGEFGGTIIFAGTSGVLRRPCRWLSTALWRATLTRRWRSPCWSWASRSPLSWPPGSSPGRRKSAWAKLCLRPSGS